MVRRMTEPKLTKREERFIEEFMTDLNGTKAAVRAGFTKNERAASVQASHLLANPKIKKLIDERQAARIAEARLSAQYVIDRMLEIDQLDVEDIFNDEMELKPLKEWPSAWRRYLNGMEVMELFAGRGDLRKQIGVLKKIKWPDKTKNLELLGRHFGVFNDKLQITGPNGQPLVIPTTIRIVAGPINELTDTQAPAGPNDGPSADTA